MKMTLYFRALLLLAALVLLLIVLRSIRRSKLVIADSLFWFFFAAVLVVLAIFPEIAFFASNLLGVQSPVNLVYLVVIGVLMWRQLRLTLRVSALDTRLEELTQQIALDEHDQNPQNPS